MRPALRLLMVAALLAPAARAQESPGLIPFDVVKLKSKDLEGRFSVVSLREGTLRVRGVDKDTAHVYTVKVATIKRIKLSLGEHSNLERAAIGVEQGLIAGIVFATVSTFADGSMLDGAMSFGGGRRLLVSGGALVGLGAIAGVVVGSHLNSNKWETVPKSSLAIGTDAAGGATFGVTIRF